MSYLDVKVPKGRPLPVGPHSSLEPLSRDEPNEANDYDTWDPLRLRLEVDDGDLRRIQLRGVPNTS